MASAFQQKKYAYLFRVFDTNKDTYIDESDFLLAADRLSELQNIAINSEEYAVQRNMHQQWWQSFSAQMDTDLDGKITLEEMVSFWSKVADLAASEAKQGKSNMADQIAASGQATFAMLDTNRSGEISINEYGIWLKSWAVATDYEASFNKLDTNRDGIIRLDEAVEMVKEFYLSDDPDAAGNHLYGILPD